MKQPEEYARSKSAALACIDVIEALLSEVNKELASAKGDGLADLIKFEKRLEKLKTACLAAGSAQVFSAREVTFAARALRIQAQEFSALSDQLVQLTRTAPAVRKLLNHLDALQKEVPETQKK